MKKLKNKLEYPIHGKLDVPLMIAVIGLVVFGIVMVYAASSYTAEVYYNNKYYYMFKQIFGVVLGLMAMLSLAFFDYHRLDKLKYIILAVSYVLLILVFIPGIGIENYGAKRWINFPFFTIQASEVAKFGFIIFAAAYMAKNYKRMTKFIGLLPILIAGGAMCVLIILEPNMSITMCVALLMFAMMFIGGVRIKHFIMLLVPLLAVAVLMIVLAPYRMDRLMAFLDPWASPLDEGYQLIQSYYSLASGGFFGLGLFNSRQKYLFLPFAESDFIFAIIGEELGFFGCLLLILVYIFIILRAIKIAQRSADRFGCYLASGIAAILGIQVIINIAVVTGSIPPTGLPLPFISAGTSSLIVFCGSIGVLLSINRFSHKSIKSLIGKHNNPKRNSNNRVRNKEKGIISKRVSPSNAANKVSAPNHKVDSVSVKQNAG